MSSYSSFVRKVQEVTCGLIQKTVHGDRLDGQYITIGRRLESFKKTEILKEFSRMTRPVSKCLPIKLLAFKGEKYFGVNKTHQNKLLVLFCVLTCKRRKR